MAYNFNIQGGADNTVRIPVRNPGGALNSARLLVYSDGGVPTVIQDVTFDGDYAIFQVPANMANETVFGGRWTLMVSSDGGVNFFAGNDGRVGVRQAPGIKDVEIANAELEISNASGDPIPVEVTNASGSPVPVMNMATFQNMRSEMETAARGGYAFAGSTGVLSAGALGTTNFRGTLSNPVNSGKTLYVAKLNTYATSTTSNVAMLINPTTGLPTTARPINNVYVGHPITSVAVLRADASATALSGGTDSGIRVPIVANRPEQLSQPPYIIPPGVTLGLSGPFSASTELVVTILWWEA